MEYLANKWYRDQVSISQLSLRYRHRIFGSRTYRYIGVSPWQYRTWKRWTGRTTESELAFVEQSENTLRIELSVGGAAIAASGLWVMVTFPDRYRIPTTDA